MPDCRYLVANRNGRYDADYLARWACRKAWSCWQAFFGIQPRVLKDDGTPASVDEGGSLVIEHPWPV